MGEMEAGEMATKKRKKKGRPSLLDLQKRSLKLQQQQQQIPDFKNPNSLNVSSTVRSNRRIPNSLNDFDDDDERAQKKHKLLLGLNNSRIALKTRKISSGSHHYLGEQGLKGTDTLQESPVEPGPTTPLPDKKLLVFILDRLQKKDSYGVFSEPADPEELPDYHDIVEHPMDFSTVRKKLDGGAYADLEQFEKDVFLICSNAMQYNPPDTIYFRQARSIQELAKKDFENLRQDSDDGEPEIEPEPEPKVVRRGRPPGKQKKPLERSHLDRVGPESFSDATLASGGDNTGSTTGYNLRKTYSYKYQPSEVLVRNSYGGETYASWMSEWENEFPASVLKAVLKYGKKPNAIDENKRDTYKLPMDSIHESSALNIFEVEQKQLMAVGLNAEYSYARSLSRFAANLGPTVWKIASKKIRSTLPTGLDFGPGWVGDDKVVDGEQQLLFSREQKFLNNSAGKNLLNTPQSTATGTNSAVTSRCSTWSREDMAEGIGGLSSQCELTSLDSSMDGINHESSVPVQQKPMFHSDLNGLNGGFGYNNNCSPLLGTERFGISTGKPSLDHTAVPSQMFGMVSTSTSNHFSVPVDYYNVNRGKLSETSNGLLHSAPNSQTMAHSGIVGGKSSWQGLSPHNQQEIIHFPPDLNVGFLAPNSPSSSSVPIGSTQQPDLALQL